MCNCAGFSGSTSNCGCSQFTGNRPSEITTDEFTGNRPSYITADEFSGNRPSEITTDFDGHDLMDRYDNFLTKKQRERRKQIKAGMQTGLSRQDARKQALASVPKSTLKDVIAKIKSGQDINVIQTPLGDVKLDPKIDEKLDELSNAIRDNTTDTDANVGEPTFFEKNKTLIIGGLVLVAGIFVYMKFIKK